MSVVITGGTGYLGTHLAMRLLNAHEDVHIVRRRGSSITQFPGLNIHFHEDDGSANALIDILERSKPTVVYHLAAHYIPAHEASDIPALVDGNILFGTRLFHAMAHTGCKTLVVVGTTWQHISNENPAPATLYAATKAGQELIASYFIDAFGLSAAFVRISDTYGPRDQRKKLFWFLRNAALTGQPLAMSPGEQYLDMIYVEDAIEALCQAGAATQATKPGKANIWIAKAARRYRLRDIVQIWQNVTQYRLSVEWGARAYRPREVMQPWDAAPGVPGWEPRVTLESGIRLMEEAYAQN